MQCFSEKPPHTACPFEKSSQINPELELGSCTLPGYPTISLQDRSALNAFLRAELWAEELEKIWLKLWWMSKVDSANISPLHRQAVKRRRIVISEEPRLHLLWVDDRIFIKPLPKYLCSYKFWTVFLCPTTDETKRCDTLASRRSDFDMLPDLRSASLGFLRSYSHLIRYESDLTIAQSCGLLPKDVSWEDWCKFSCHFGAIADVQVSGRYHFGEIRITRLNFYAPLLLGKTQYHRLHHQYAEYFGRYAGPLLFCFAMLSVVLDSLQVASQTYPGVGNSQIVALFFFWLSIAIAISVVGIALVLGILWLAKVIREWRRAIPDWASADCNIKIRDGITQSV
jgi:hypothetical protein